ncbi:hypothetical protein [Methyloceanibacter marginalis]|uniref:hypothetical protein n=1 Tax=Methyloceanibacter marginalis TaxID=1774971 RepID=UPI00114D111F|nr:hypothetical protein [Methyloceanibacter marginalis]
MRLERIVSTGQATAEGDWYDQAWDEFVVLVSGARACGSRVRTRTARLKPATGSCSRRIAAIA